SGTGNSREITTNQTGLNEHLDEVVLKHLAHPFRKPYRQHTVEAFKQMQAIVAADPRPIIFDSCCGVGESTSKIAQLHPNCLVFGMDKSSDRLDRNEQHKVAGQEYYLFQVDLNDLWRLAVDAGWQLHKHYILYPNPWPKAKHLQRRWHGAAVFPSLLALGGELELRSNWPLYLQEFQRALALAQITSQLHVYAAAEAITPFERKYWASGQASWQLMATL
ncbi:MAG: tRNA G46 methylase TrmB, partial [Cocleimonas sp.]